MDHTLEPVAMLRKERMQGLLISSRRALEQVGFLMTLHGLWFDHARRQWITGLVRLVSFFTRSITCEASPSMGAGTGQR